MIESDISVIGAGPAGSTAALFLSKSGQSCVLIDREEFPRDKICGDCLGGYVISVLRQLDSDIFNEFLHFQGRSEGRGVHFFGPGQEKLSVPVNYLVDNKIREVSVSKRKDFDNFLLDEARKRKEIKVFSGINLHTFRKEPGYLIFSDREGNEMLKTRLAIIATGSQSKIAMEISGYRTIKRNLAGGLRYYYENIKPAGEPGYIEFHFLKELLPGYLWIFPVNETLVNVGLGQRSDILEKRKTDLKKMLPELIDKYPYLRERFAGANLISGPEGYPLSLGSARRVISGDNFLLAGDAASLIEPFFGEGIGNAMYSGKFAAEQAISCINENDFSALFNRKYDKAVYRKLGNALRMSTLLQNAATHPRLVKRIFRNIDKQSGLQKMLVGIINGDIARNPLLGIKFLIRSLGGF